MSDGAFMLLLTGIGLLVWLAAVIGWCLDDSPIATSTTTETHRHVGVSSVSSGAEHSQADT